MRNLTCSSLSIALLAALSLATGCDKKSESTPAPTTSNTSAQHAHGDHDHGHDHGHGETVELGTKPAGAWSIKASRDGEVTAGHDLPIDVWITGDGPSVVAVRFWIGTEDGTSSLKAKAEIEKDNWHTHVEIPSPLPSGSQLWIEIETEAGEPMKVAFDLTPAN